MPHCSCDYDDGSSVDSTRVLFVGGTSCPCPCSSPFPVVFVVPFSVVVVVVIAVGGRFRCKDCNCGGNTPRWTHCSISSISAGLEALATSCRICSFSSAVKLVVITASVDRPSPGTKVLVFDVVSPWTSASNAAPAALLANRSARSRSVLVTFI